ncbi:MAG TPA: lysylphosphatidylglycerol synthase transmembrane domain-containing protein [Gaiellaceae bacterium]|nr:lysylphosphatidylglycerol synthase transmembrane domain-containing protein [Gaiellaceae bacterium]
MKLSAPRIVVAALALAVVVAAAATPQLLGTRVVHALATVQRADRGWLALATLGFATGFVSAVCAWRAALAASGGRISVARGTAALGVGALVNTFVPARLGDVVKIALFSRAIDGPDRLWTAGGVYAAVSAARCLSIAALVAVATVTGAIPIWPVLVLCAAAAACAALALTSRRWRRYHRIAHLLEGFAALERSPRFAAQVLGWSFGVALTRLGAVIALAAALGLPDPLLAALVICPTLDLAGSVPLTPGNVGVASGAVAVALQSRGIGVTQALGVGIAIQALEMLVSLAAGTAGLLSLAAPGSLAARRPLRIAVVGTAVAVAAALGAFMLDAV